MASPRGSRPTRDPALEPGVAIRELEKLKAEAADPRVLYRQGESARESWKARVLAVMTRSLGTGAEIADKMRSNRYGLFAWSEDTPDSAWEGAFAGAIGAAIGYIDAAMYELSLLEEQATRTRALTSVRLCARKLP